MDIDLHGSSCCIRGAGEPQQTLAIAKPPVSAEAVEELTKRLAALERILNGEAEAADSLYSLRFAQEAPPGEVKNGLLEKS